MPSRMGSKTPAERADEDPENLNSEFSLDDLLKLLSEYDISLDDFLRLIADAVRRTYRIYHLRFHQADMDDIAQEIVLLLIKDDCQVLRSFEGRSSLETWMQPIASHKTLRFYRGQKEMLDLEDLSPDDQAYPPNQDNTLLRDEIARRLTKCQRELFELLDQGFKPKEIAKRKKIKPSSVSKEKSRLHDRVSEILKTTLNWT